MKEISLRYQEIYSTVYKKRAEDRYDHIVSMIESVIDDLKIDPQYFHVDLHRLSNLVDSYFLDVIRYKEYHFNYDSNSYEDKFSKESIFELHENKLINESKVVSFLVKWFLRYAPITVLRQDIDDDIPHLNAEDKLILESINEYIALQIILYTLFEKEEHDLIDDCLTESLFYDLKYRFFDEKIYFSRIELLQKLVKKSKDPQGSSDSSIRPLSEALKVKGGTMKKVRLLKVFVSSASDVEELRDVSNSVLSEFNNKFNSAFKIDFYMWEKDKQAGYLGNDQDYMDQVLDQFGEYCDLFILILWKKIGEGTKREYSFFKETLLPKNPNIRLLVFHYGENTSPKSVSEAQERLELMTWLDDHQNSWAPLGNVRRSIQNRHDYEIALRTALHAIT